jgi:SAM-dependent methyltransferase
VTPAAAAPEAERLRRQAAAVWARELAALRALGLADGARLLEVGCGPGAVLARLIADARPRLAVGAELSAAHARRAAAVARVVRADGACVPFAGGSFDAVLFRLVLRHCPDPEALVAEAARLVAPGGRVFIVDADDATLALRPAPAGFAALWAALAATARRRGGDPALGRRARGLLLAAGLTDAREQILRVTTDDLPPAAFVADILAPEARPLDGDLLPAGEAARAWAEVRAWAARPDAVGSLEAIAASARRPP